MTNRASDQMADAAMRVATAELSPGHTAPLAPDAAPPASGANLAAPAPSSWPERHPLRYYVTLGALGHVTLWHVHDQERNIIVASWGTRTAAEADAHMRNRRAALR